MDAESHLMCPWMPTVGESRDLCGKRSAHPAGTSRRTTLSHFSSIVTLLKTPLNLNGGLYSLLTGETEFLPTSNTPSEKPATLGGKLFSAEATPLIESRPFGAPE